ncbi:MAG: TetR/AcrR family transcriptional regulator [Chakrabartia godavariana]
MSRIATDRKDIRRQSIVAVARKAFLRDGYGGTTMSSIAAAVGGSKTTLWSYFPSKQDLFAAVIDDMVERYGEALRVPLPPDGDPAETLRAIARSLMKTLMRPQIIAFHRMITGEAGRFPEIGAVLFERGPARGHARLSAWLAGQMDKGVLRSADPLVAAKQFLALCQAGQFQMKLIGAVNRANPDAVAIEIDQAVDTFLRAYAPR